MCVCMLGRDRVQAGHEFVAVFVPLPLECKCEPLLMVLFTLNGYSYETVMILFVLCEYQALHNEDKFNFNFFFLVSRQGFSM